jgi:hypothetical protein
VRRPFDFGFDWDSLQGAQIFLNPQYVRSAFGLLIPMAVRLLRKIGSSRSSQLGSVPGQSGLDDLFRALLQNLLCKVVPHFRVIAQGFVVGEFQ